MKKIVITTLALALLTIGANAQEAKTPAEVKAAVSNAVKASQDEKKATKVGTWFKLGQAYLDGYVSAQGYGSVGMSEQEVDLIMSTVKKSGTSTEAVGGVEMKKVSYPTADYYYQNGRLAIIKTTAPIVDNALDNAASALLKANEVDEKGQKAKDTKALLERVAAFYTEEAYVSYRFGKYDEASVLFEKTYELALKAPLSRIDTTAVYNAAFTSYLFGEYERAMLLYTKSLEYGFAGESGDAYVRLADIAEKQGDKALSKSYLEQGFTKYPQSQGILVGLINYYITSGESTSELFALIDQAKKNEPGNASLYYVEGNVHKNLGEIEAAIASFDQCSVINPEYEYGLIGKGILYYEQALKFQELASQENDNDKWDEYNKSFENALKLCIEPFEKAFDLTKDAAVRKNISEYLKNACFRFRTESDEFMKKYEKYSAAMAE